MIFFKRNEIVNFIAFKRYIFSHKRKKLGNLLKKYKDKDIPKLDMRAENLSLNEFIEIFRIINL